MSLDRRRTYLNYLFENMTYLTKLDYGLYTNLELISGREYKSNNILSMYNLSSYNRMMLIFQTGNSTSWDSNNMYILVLNRGEGIQFLLVHLIIRLLVLVDLIVSHLLNLKIMSYTFV